jgi:hypothetical protein
MGTKTTKKAESTSTAVALSMEVPSVIAALEAKIKALDHITDSKYRTGGKLDGFGDIKQETNISNLIKAFSSIRGREKAYAEAAEEMGLSTFPVFEANGSTSEDWKQDILLRIAIINHKDTLDKLTEYRNKMKEFLSKEDQKAILFAEMEAFMSKM